VYRRECEGSTTVRPEKGRYYAYESVGKVTVRQEITRDRRRFVRERKFTGKVGGPTDEENRVVQEGEGNYGERLGREEGRQSRIVCELTEGGHRCNLCRQ
jgi:hypothetical protein